MLRILDLCLIKVNLTSEGGGSHFFNIRFLNEHLATGATGDAMDLQVAMAPCSLGYGEIGRKLYDDPNTKRGAYS